MNISLNYRVCQDALLHGTLLRHGTVFSCCFHLSLPFISSLHKHLLLFLYSKTRWYRSCAISETKFVMVFEIYSGRMFLIA